MKRWLTVPTDAERGVANLHCSDVYRCSCGYGAIWPTPTPSAIEKFYEFDYYTHRPARPPPDIQPFLLDRVRQHLAWWLDRDRLSVAEWIRRELGTRSTVCDIGCGGGGKMRDLQELGYTMTGIEPDTAAVARASASGMDVFAGSAENIPLELDGQQFDAAIMMHVLEHCARPLKALHNVKRLLRPGARFICEVPNNDAIGRIMAGVTWKNLDIPRHLHFFTGPSLRAHLERAGFDVLKTEYVHYSRQFSNDAITNERRIQAALGFGPRNSRLRAWALLALTAFAPARFKYDSVRIVARA